jgi:hypothetical protein
MQAWLERVHQWHLDGVQLHLDVDLDQV